MTKMLFVGALIVLASELVSWANPPVYKDETAWHTVKRGDTYWSIACDYIDEQNKYNSLDEFIYVIRKTNEARLPSKYLRVGDVVEVPISKK